MGWSPTVQRWDLARDLRTLRLPAGWGRSRFPNGWGGTPSKLSRIESGRFTLIDLRDVEDLLRLYEVADNAEWNGFSAWRLSPASAVGGSPSRTPESSEVYCPIWSGREPDQGLRDRVRSWAAPDAGLCSRGRVRRGRSGRRRGGPPRRACACQRGTPRSSFERHRVLLYGRWVRQSRATSTDERYI
jgi:hypothetical protein